MRSRTTWKGTATPRQAATSRKADIYTMNQEHPQPSVTEYVNGDPDSWAETPVPAEKSPVNEEYEGDAVKRNEVGLGEFRTDTFKHKDSERWGGPGKYDNAKVSAERKALACERVARAVLRTDNQKLIEDTALGLMSLPNQVLASTLTNMRKASIQAMPAEARHRRAMACVKLSHRLLGSAATEESVEQLGGLFMKVEDSTLKGMIAAIATAMKVAQEQQAEEETQTAQQEEPKVEEAQTACDDAACLETAPAPATDEFAELFDGVGEEAAAPAAAPTVVALPGSDVDITFDDDDAAAPADSVTTLSALFADHPEVVAQRQVTAASAEQAARESGVQKTAGAKKLGQVRKASTQTESVVERLSKIW